MAGGWGCDDSGRVQGCVSINDLPCRGFRVTRIDRNHLQPGMVKWQTVASCQVASFRVVSILRLTMAFDARMTTGGEVRGELCRVWASLETRELLCPTLIQSNHWVGTALDDAEPFPAWEKKWSLNWHLSPLPDSETPLTSSTIYLEQMSQAKVNSGTVCPGRNLSDKR